MEGGYNLDRQSRHFEGEPETRVKWNQGLLPVETPAASGVSAAVSTVQDGAHPGER